MQVLLSTTGCNLSMLGRSQGRHVYSST